MIISNDNYVTYGITKKVEFRLFLMEYIYIKGLIKGIYIKAYPTWSQFRLIKHDSKV